MTLEERIERLEKLYEKVYHDYELLAILIPRLTEILIKYFGENKDHRYSIMRDLKLGRDWTRLMEKDLRGHLKNPSPPLYNYISIKEDESLSPESEVNGE